MTIRNLEMLLAPRSIAMIGASDRPKAVGAIVTRNLLAGGFKGDIWLVNPGHAEVSGRLSYASIAALPGVPDLAVISTPPDTVPGIIGELGRKGCRAAVVITAGLRGPLKQAMLDAAKPYLLRIQGPNCLGLMLPPIGVNATFSHVAPAPGKLAFLSQSGALITGIVDWAVSRGIGFSHVVSMGDMADVDVGDLLDYLAGDRESHAILMYLESITAAPKFMSAARRAARSKPVIVIKSGRHASGATAALSHTGALAGADKAYEAAFRRSGLLRVQEMSELFSAAEVLAKNPRLSGERLAIITNGGGAGVLAADRLGDFGIDAAALSPSTIARLDAALPATWSRANPVDIIGDADAKRFEAAVDAVLDDPAIDATLVLNCPTALNPSLDAAHAVTRALEARRAAGKRDKPVLTNWLGVTAAAPSRDYFAAHGIPTFDTPANAVEAFWYLVRHRRAQLELMTTPPSLPDAIFKDGGPAAPLIASALASGRTMLTEIEAKDLLSAYEIPITPTQIATSPEQAGEMAAALIAQHGACVLKILSIDISHKSDVGGVRINLETPTQVRDAAEQMLVRVGERKPDARISGFTIQPMIRRPGAHELLLGISVDETFGPLVTFGTGGTGVEVIRDTAQALPPLDLNLARDLMAQTRVWKLLQGYRDRPRADIDAIAMTLVRLSYLAARHPEIREIDINPLLADEKGVIALDARVRIADETTTPRTPLAIRPYPSEWERTVARPELAPAGLGEILIRPIRPEDEALYAAFFEKIDKDDVRLRFFSPNVSLSHAFLARLTQIDYAREIAFVAISKKSGALLGVARFIADPDFVTGEYGVLVRSDLKGKGLGWALMTQMIDYARASGLQQIYGEVLAHNTTMLAMCRDLGFVISMSSDDPSIVRATLRIN
ncbi:MAG: bifunctional acetate--CoA ligase family protein/GNAT family N-acetyltransferase [Hyphomicrobiaceae bacterium]